MRLLSVQGNLSIPEKTALSFYGFSCLLGIILAKASHIVRERGLNWLSLFAAALIIHLYSIPQHKGPARLISQFFCRLRRAVYCGQNSQETFFPWKEVSCRPSGKETS
jgi:hypothetical protein